MKMTPEFKTQLRIAIADACGWTNIRELDDIYPDGQVAAGVWWQGVPPKASDLEGDQLLPDYPNDLNAMHDAENVLLRGYEDDPEGSELWSDYQTNLILACPAYLSYHATAAHKSEAFCRTLKIGPFAE